MIYGVDIDGILANFTDAYAELLTKASGVKFPKHSPDWPKVWYWERETPGITKAIEQKVWNEIMTSDFWAHLHALPGALETLNLLDHLAFKGDDVYFITSRPGKRAKYLTEYWLRSHGMTTPTVLISPSDAAKGQLANALKLDVFIDDKPENCIEVRLARPSDCRVFLVDRPYNRNVHPIFVEGIERVSSALQALERVTESHGEQFRRAA